MGPLGARQQWKEFFLSPNWGQKCLGWVIFGWKPWKSSKSWPILDIQVALTDFHWDEAKKTFGKKIQKWPTQKTWVFQNRQFSFFFFVKISWIGPWVGRIDWWEGHWSDSTYMFERLSDISSKTGKKCILCVFRLFLRLPRTASRPYRLSYINTLCINQSYLPKDQSMKFSQTIFENWRFWKTQFFWVGHFGILFSKKKLLNPHENQSNLLGYEGWVEILMITLVSSQKSPNLNISAPSVYVDCVIQKNYYNHIQTFFFLGK